MICHYLIILVLDPLKSFTAEPIRTSVLDNIPNTIDFQKSNGGTSKQERGHFGNNELATFSKRDE